MAKVTEVICLLVCLITGPSIIHCHNEDGGDGCGKTLGCYTCADDADNCKAGKKYTMTYRKEGDSIEFEMSAKNQWVALGFNSKPSSMGGTDAVMCTTISGDVKLQHYELVTTSLPGKTVPLPSQLELINGTYQDGQTTCRFKRKIDASGSSLKNLDTPHYLVFAYGPVDVGTSEPSYHKWRSTTDKAVDVQFVPSLIEGSTIPALIQANGNEKGCLMTIAWMCCISIFMARQ